MKAPGNNKSIPQSDLATAVRQGDRQAAAHSLRQRASCPVHSPEFREYLVGSATALENNNWEQISEHFLNNRYIDNCNNVLILAPYSRWINGQNITKLTLLVGKICCYSPVKMEDTALDLFGRLNQKIPKLQLIDAEIAIGNIGNEEAFLSPEGWQVPMSEGFAPILVTNLHVERLNTPIQRRIKLIFEPETAQLLLCAMTESQAIMQEYVQHETGHSLGMGIDLKTRLGLLKNPHQGGCEEFKTDIAGWRLAAAVLPPTMVGKLIACTMLIRMGIDFTRPGAPTQDPNAISALLSLDRFLQSGEMYLTSDRLLALRDVSWDGLFQATKLHRSEAEDLVREELDRLHDPSSIIVY